MFVALIPDPVFLKLWFKDLNNNSEEIENSILRFFSSPATNGGCCSYTIHCNLLDKKAEKKSCSFLKTLQIWDWSDDWIIKMAVVSLHRTTRKFPMYRVLPLLLEQNIIEESNQFVQVSHVFLCFPVCWLTHSNSGDMLQQKVKEN